MDISRRKCTSARARATIEFNLALVMEVCDEMGGVVGARIPLILRELEFLRRGELCCRKMPGFLVYFGLDRSSVR